MKGMKKTVALFFAFSMMLFVANAQIVTPVHWTWKAEQTSKGEYKLTFTAKIDKGWHTYSQYIGDGGPVPTKISFDSKNKDVQLIGKTTETGPKIHDEHDPVFNMQLKYFETELTCTQKPASESSFMYLPGTYFGISPLVYKTYHGFLQVLVLPGAL